METMQQTTIKLCERRIHCIEGGKKPTTNIFNKRRGGEDATQQQQEEEEKNEHIYYTKDSLCSYHLICMILQYSFIYLLVFHTLIIIVL
jgi:hypothetical protein